MGAEWPVHTATRDDAAAIAAMYQETWPVYWETPECVAAQFDVLEAIGGRALVVREAERVVGHCEFIPTREPEPVGFWGYLEALEVHRAFYRRGIGTALVREAARRCEELGCIRFGTSPDDERSEGLYRKCGMTRVERCVTTHFAIAGEPPEPPVEAAEPLSPDERPWEQLLHVLGRTHCAAYWWSMGFHRKAAGEDGYTDTRADRLLVGGHAAVVFNCGSWLHVLLPPDRASDAALAQAAVAHGARWLRSQGRDSFHTVMPLALADAVRAVPGIFPSESRFHFHMSMPLGEAVL